jgi:hypothetical protein
MKSGVAARSAAKSVLSVRDPPTSTARNDVPIPTSRFQILPLPKSSSAYHALRSQVRMRSTKIHTMTSGSTVMRYAVMDST